MSIEMPVQNGKQLSADDTNFPELFPMKPKPMEFNSKLSSIIALPDSKMNASFVLLMKAAIEMEEMTL